MYQSMSRYLALMREKVSSKTATNQLLFKIELGSGLFIKTKTYTMEVPPTEPTAVKIWRWASANVYE
jgi:hypothetical protein